ncbi:MAG: 5,6-dimethylbenzimidazole synthase [Verrucomicrobiota bacterium]
MHISETEKEAIYKTIFSRRDIRSEFLPDMVPDEILNRILTAGHHAPSVGFMQPWDFIVIRDKQTKSKVLRSFEEENHKAQQLFEGERAELYSTLKLQGIMEAPVNICVTCDRTRNGETGLGRTTQKEMDLYSTVCAVQNIWLAARAENIGVGWVSILDHNKIKSILDIPSDIVVVAYLCVGYVNKFHDLPELERNHWEQRLPLEKLIHYESW